MYTKYLFLQLGKGPADFFQITFFTYSYDDVAYGVADGLADGHPPIEQLDFAPSIGYGHITGSKQLLAETIRINDL